MSNRNINQIPALIIRQWLQSWNKVNYRPLKGRKKPDPFFYLFSLSAKKLKKLSNIYRRKADKPRLLDSGIQRAHDPKRSEEIKKFVHGGFPWSDLSDRQKKTREYRDLRMPGWLPTAIIANILPPKASRGKHSLKDEDIIRIKKIDELSAQILLPERLSSSKWNPIIPPLEIIDGQHRLWSFESEAVMDGDFELPVVAFYNLDLTWRAYLFYTINIKPKRINTSLAFDLYPILRIQEWLDKSPQGPSIYREARAQELTEILWSHPNSPWHKRINMLGAIKSGPVTQAAFIRSLMSSYVKKLHGRRGKSLGGIFGAQLGFDTQDILNWNRAYQAGFLILVWQEIKKAVNTCNKKWATHLRVLPNQLELLDESKPDDEAFDGKFTLLSTDQGVRGILQVTNDMCYIAATELGLDKLFGEDEIEEDIVSDAIVSSAINSIKKLSVDQYLKKIAKTLINFDWRISSTPRLTVTERKAQMVFRGSGGYRELRKQLLEILADSKDEFIKNNALKILSFLGYDE